MLLPRKFGDFLFKNSEILPQKLGEFAFYFKNMKIFLQKKKVYFLYEKLGEFHCFLRNSEIFFTSKMRFCLRNSNNLIFTIKTRTFCFFIQKNTGILPQKLGHFAFYLKNSDNFLFFFKKAEIFHFISKTRRFSFFFIPLNI